jgi:hemoglobin
MLYSITQSQIGTRPPVELPNPEILQHLGEDGMRKLVSDQYDLLRASKIKGLFPPSDEGFALAKKHSSDFFIQICGGTRHFDQSRGRPMMAARHAPFAITQEARRIWLESYIIVLQQLDMSEELKESFWNYIDIFSIWMMNTED